MKKERIIGLAIIIIFIVVVAFFFISSKTAKGRIPSYVTGEKRAMYEWAKTPEGVVLLEQVPCYCGCKYEGHKHVRHCFWKDDGTFDKHGITCAICIDIAKETKQMHEEGKDICEIRKEIDSFYAAHADLATPTPMPEGCGE